MTLRASILALLMTACGAPPDTHESPPSTRSEDWNGDGRAEVVETLDAQGRPVGAEYFAGTVDAFSRSTTYDERGRPVLIETAHARGTNVRAFPIYRGDELVAVRRVELAPDGTETVHERALETPCTAPWACADDC